MAYDGVSMEKIASETGLARTTLYSRFRRNPTCSVQSTGDVKDIGEVLCLRVADMASLLVDPLFGGLHALILLNRRRFPDLAPLMHELGYLNALRLLAQDIRAAAQRDGTSQPEAVAEHILTAEAYRRKVVDLMLLDRDLW